MTWFKKSKLEKFDNVRIRLIDDGADELYERLGITMERNMEIRDLVINFFALTEDIAETMEKVSKYCTHPNETALASFALGYYLGDQLAQIQQDEE